MPFTMDNIGFKEGNRIVNFNSFGRSTFLKKKVAGLEFILSEAEGLQSFLKRKGFTLLSLTQIQL